MTRTTIEEPRRPPTSSTVRRRKHSARNSAEGERPGLAHLRALDGLRGVAVLAVLAYHFEPGLAPGGFLGVDLFFVLSGFLITSLLVTEWEATNRISLVRFWGRRARRLLPALFLVLAAVGVYGLFVGSRVDAHHTAQDGLSAFAYVANWHFIASGQSYIQQFVGTAPSPLRHMWSLAIEEQFYLVWPVLVVVIARLVRRRARQLPLRRVLVVACVGIGVVSFARMLRLYHPGLDPIRVYYGTDTRMFVILVGAALGALSAGVPALPRPWRGLVVGLGCLGVVALGGAVVWATTSSAWLYEGGYGAVALIMVVVLAAAAQPGINPLARILETPALVGLGLISYGVYLWHWPITLWVTARNTGVSGVALTLVRTAITLAVALASYYLIEQPIRRGRLPRWRVTNPIVVPMVLVSAVALVLLIPAVAFPSVDPVPTGDRVQAAAVSARYQQAHRCDGPSGSPRPKPTRPIRVQLIGNSIADEIRPCLGTILKPRGATVEGVSHQVTAHICPSIPKAKAQVDNPATRPDAAILFAWVVWDDACGPPSSWHTPIDQLVAIWKNAGVHIYLVPAVPAVPGHYPNENAHWIAYEVLPIATASYYQQLASQDPAHITVVDAGTFVRADNGQYPWRMPCLPGEHGCDAHHTVGIRFTDGFHFCTDPHYNGGGCPPASRAGERRAAAAVAAGLLSSPSALPG